MIIGSHVSFSKEKQLLGSIEEALSYGSNTCMIYTGAPQNTNRAPISTDLTNKAIELMKENNFKEAVAHAPYIVNLANDKKNYQFSIDFIKQELERCKQLNIKKLVLHPGSSVGLTKQEGLDNIVKALNQILNKDSIYICLETMAGKGNELGTNIEELKYIIDNTRLSEKILVCLDTCHLNDSGVDISRFDEYLEEFDKKIGISKIGCVHINDSMNELGTKKDRHNNIGLGTIGFTNLINVIYNEKLKDVPKILETPYITKEDSDKDKLYPPYKFEIEAIKNKKIDLNLKENIRNYYK